MKVPAPEGRKCEECLNTMTLNLFRLNSSTCRYCQDGLSIPSRLIDQSTKRNDDLADQTIINKEPIEKGIKTGTDESNANSIQEQTQLDTNDK